MLASPIILASRSRKLYRIGHHAGGVDTHRRRSRCSPGRYSTAYTAVSRARARVRGAAIRPRVGSYTARPRRSSSGIHPSAHRTADAAQSRDARVDPHARAYRTRYGHTHAARAGGLTRGRARARRGGDTLTVQRATAPRRRAASRRSSSRLVDRERSFVLVLVLVAR